MDICSVKQKFEELELVINSIDQKHELDEELLHELFNYLITLDDKGDCKLKLVQKLIDRLDML